MSFGYIYRLLFPNGKSYIGQTHKTPEERYKGHCRDARNGGEYPVHYAIKKYGKESVKIETICEADSQENLDELEIKYIADFNSLKDNGKGYNQTIGGGGTVGYKFTDEQRKNARVAQQKRKIERPDIAQNSSVFMTQFHKDNPEIGENHSKKMKQRAKDHPEIGENHSKKMKELYENEPERKKKMSDIKKKQNEDNPELAKRQSEIKNELYESENGVIIKKKISNKSKEQWADPIKKKKIMDEKRKRFTLPAFSAYNENNEPVKDESGNIIKFTYLPDCSMLLFGEIVPSLGKVLNGERKWCRKYTLKYC